MLGMVIAGHDGYSEAAFRKVGFKAKIKFHKDVRSGTFLKGKWWLATDGTLHWASLLGRLIKLGKVSCPLDTPAEVATMAYAVAQNMGEINFDFPILGPYRRKLLELAEKDCNIGKLHLPKFDFGYSQHRIRNQVFDVDRTAALDDIVDRYDLSLEAILEMESMINKVKSLPWFLGHPGFEALRREYL
jgi:hypothetical protein